MSLTIKEYAEAKQLDIAFLRELGVTELANQDGPYLRVPYRDEAGVEIAVRFRHELEGPNRFRWKFRSKLALYGLDRLADARRESSIIIVEGESDCHTLWQAGVPAVGLPGATNWREDRDLSALDGVAKIFIVREPDGGGDGVMRWLRRSSIRHRAHIVSLGEHKDPSALYLADPGSFAERMRQALAGAAPFHVLEAAARDAEAEEAFERCRDLATAADILALLRESLARIGVVGEDRNACVLYLALVSRLLPKPVSVVVKGPSSGGKSYTVDRVLDHFPPEAFLKFSSMSERALCYLEDDIAHRHIVFAEAAGAEGEMQAYLLRTLLSEGRLSYAMVEKTPQGLAQRTIEKEGPTGLILTTTKIRVHAENETRLLSLTTNDTREQTRAIMRSIAGHTNESTIDPQWHNLQTWLARGERRVAVPFLAVVAELAAHGAVRMRRDFGAIKSLIEAHALLHRASRERDGEGRIVATLADYAAVRELVADLVAEGHAATVKPQVRETVEAVRTLMVDGTHPNGKAVAAFLHLDESAASRRCAEAVKLGFIANEEAQRGRAARYVVTDPMPDDAPVLPTAEAVADALAAREGEEGVYPPTQLGNRATEDTNEEADACAVARLREGTASPPPLPSTALKRSDADHDRFEETAARFEYEEGLPRTVAEAKARALLNGEIAPSAGPASTTQ